MRRCPGVDAATLARQLRAVAGRTMLTIVKDCPRHRPC
jgi:hypothetical protein